MFVDFLKVSIFLVKPNLVKAFLRLFQFLTRVATFEAIYIPLTDTVMILPLLLSDGLGMTVCLLLFDSFFSNQIGIFRCNLMCGLSLL
jgi:hypothetical protein